MGTIANYLRHGWDTVVQSEHAARALSAVVIMLLGAFLLFGAGFAQPHLLHEAAHDARHAAGFPCH